MLFPVLCHNSYHTWGDFLHKEGALGGQSEAMRVEIWVPLDLNIEAERVIPLISASGLCCFAIHSYPVSAEEQMET